jgi:hypothetical protein
MRGERAERARGAEQSEEEEEVEEEERVKGKRGSGRRRELGEKGWEKNGPLSCLRQTDLFLEQSPFPAHPAPRRDMLGGICHLLHHLLLTFTTNFRLRAASLRGSEMIWKLFDILTLTVFFFFFWLHLR